MFVCDDCGSEKFPNQMKLYRGQWLCSECRDRLAVPAGNSTDPAGSVDGGSNE